MSLFCLCICTYSIPSGRQASHICVWYGKQYPILEVKLGSAGFAYLEYFVAVILLSSGGCAGAHPAWCL